MRQGGVSQLGGRRGTAVREAAPCRLDSPSRDGAHAVHGHAASDAVLLGPDHVKNGWIKFTPKKASGTTGKTLELPLLKVLDDVINASATGAETFLVTSQGTK
jgi:hypothetical protein